MSIVSIRVDFTDPSEFLAELRQSAIEAKIVRATKQWRSTPAPFGRVYVVATAVTLGTGDGPGHLLQLTRYVGDDWGKNASDQNEVLTRADQILGDIESACGELGLQVRAGVFKSALSAEERPIR